LFPFSFRVSGSNNGCVIWSSGCLTWSLRVTVKLSRARGCRRNYLRD
jgi:hypothetical protein